MEPIQKLARLRFRGQAVGLARPAFRVLTHNGDDFYVDAERSRVKLRSEMGTLEPFLAEIVSLDRRALPASRCPLPGATRLQWPVGDRVTPGKGRHPALAPGPRPGASRLMESATGIRACGAKDERYEGRGPGAGRQFWVGRGRIQGLTRGQAPRDACFG